MRKRDAGSSQKQQQLLKMLSGRVLDLGGEGGALVESMLTVYDSGLDSVGFSQTFLR